MPEDASCHVHRKRVLHNESLVFLTGEILHIFVVDGLHNVIIRFGVNVEKSCLDIITFSDYYHSGVRFTAYTIVYEFVYSKPAAMVNIKLLLCLIN
jgi:hypothetical protein